MKWTWSRRMNIIVLIIPHAINYFWSSAKVICLVAEWHTKSVVINDTRLHLPCSVLHLLLSSPPLHTVVLLEPPRFGWIRRFLAQPQNNRLLPQVNRLAFMMTVSILTPHFQLPEFLRQSRGALLREWRFQAALQQISLLSQHKTPTEESTFRDQSGNQLQFHLQATHAGECWCFIKKGRE